MDKCDKKLSGGSFAEDFDIVGTAAAISAFIVEQIRPEDLGVVTSLLNAVRDNILLIFAERERKRRLCEERKKHNRRGAEDIVEETEEEFRRS